MPKNPLQQLTGLYAEMEARYAEVAGQIGLTCAECPDNCCTSYFQHHTYVEWAYLWLGLSELPEERLRDIRERAARYVEDARRMLAEQRIPDMMCPLNEEGRCVLYAHRLMICRLHGVPNVFALPNGLTKEFAGCFRSQELVGDNAERPRVDRTDFYRRLAGLEVDFVRNMSKKPHRVRLTLAEMIHLGPPT